MEKQGKVVSREEIMERLWGNEEFVDANTLTVNITRIRKILEAAGVNDFITTKELTKQKKNKQSLNCPVCTYPNCCFGKGW